jgi:hypothetical protein
MNVWNKISEVNNRNFDATGDIRFALISLAASAQRPSRPQFRVKQPLVEDFVDELLAISDSGGGVLDAMQMLLNKSAAAFLEKKLASVKQDTPVFKSMIPTEPSRDLISEVLLYDNETIKELGVYIAAQQFPTPEIKQAVSEVMSDRASIVNLISFVTSLVFARLVKVYILQNPMLSLLDADIVKSAAKEKPGFESRSPRLSDLIDAMRIAHGKYLIEYNQAATADFLKGGRDSKTLFPTGDPAGLNKSLNDLPAQMMILKSAYIKHYNAMRAALFDYCSANPMDIGTRTISKAGEVLTTDIYLGTASLENTTSIVSLIPKESKLASLNLTTTMWNGEKYKITSAGIGAKDLHNHYFANREYGQLAAESLDDADQDMEMAREHMKIASAQSTVRGLSSIMKVPNVAIASQIFEEIIAVSNAKVSKTISDNKDLYLEASNEARKVFGGSNTSSFGGTEFKTKEIDNMYMFNEEILFTLESIRTFIFDKYGDYFKDTGALGNLVTALFRTYAMPLIPIGIRYLYNAPSAQKLTGKDLSKSENFIENTLPTIFPGVIATLKSTTFGDRYSANESDYKSIASNKNETVKMRDASLGLDDNEELLLLLGLDKVSVEKKHKELSLAYASSGPQGMARKRDLINKIITDSISAFEKIPFGARGGLTRDHVIVYLCEKVLPGVIEEYVIESLASKSELQTQEQYESISKFVSTNLMALSVSTNGRLKSNTVYGKLSELFAAKEGTPDKKGSPTGAIMRGAVLGLSSSSMGDATKILGDLFERNKDDLTSEHSWSDQSDPKPRNYQELAHVAGAFADPIPDFGKSKMALIKRKRVNIQPGERFTQESLKERGESASTVEGTLRNIIRGLGKNIAGNPVLAVRIAFGERRRQILEVSPQYEKDMRPYTVSGSVPYSESPFISDENKESEIDIDFTSAESVKNSDEARDVADEPSKLDQIMEEIASKGTPLALQEKVRRELQRLPASSLNDDRLHMTIDMVLRKVDPSYKPQAGDGQKASPAAPQSLKGSSYIDSLSRTIFSSGTLADRLVPKSNDSKAKLNSKAEEIMKYLHPLMSARQELISEVRKNPSLAAGARLIIDNAKKYTNEMIKALDLSKSFAEDLDSGGDDSDDFSYVRSSIPSMRDRLKQFISAMSASPDYRDRSDVVKRVGAALYSLVDSDDMMQILHPKNLQLLLLELSNRMKAGDSFDNLLTDVDQFRVGASISKAVDPKNLSPEEEEAARKYVEQVREKRDIRREFENQQSTYEDAINKDRLEF